MGVTLKIGKDLFDSDTNPSLGAETAAVIQKLKTVTAIKVIIDFI